VPGKQRPPRSRQRAKRQRSKQEHHREWEQRPRKLQRHLFERREQPSKHTRKQQPSNKRQQRWKQEADRSLVSGEAAAATMAPAPRHLENERSLQKAAGRAGPNVGSPSCYQLRFVCWVTTIEGLWVLRDLPALICVACMLT
jgi:hypothetical protein